MFADAAPRLPHHVPIRTTVDATTTRLPVDARQQAREARPAAREIVETSPSSVSRPFAAAESGNTRYATWSTSSAALGATACSTSAKVPRRVSIVFGRLTSASISIAPASSGLCVGNASYNVVGPIIGVRTSGMWMFVKVTPSPYVSVATTRLNASRAAFDATYAENRGGLACTPIDDTLTMWPNRRSLCAAAVPG